MKKDLVKLFLDKGILISPDFIENVPEESYEEFILSLDNLDQNIVYINEDVYEGVKNNKVNDIKWGEFEKSRVLFEKGVKNNYEEFINEFRIEITSNEKLDVTKKELIIKNQGISISIKKDFQIIKQYSENVKKRCVDDFVAYFRYRYNFLKDLLLQRIELQEALSISRVLNKEEGESVSVIGLIKDKRVTKNGHIILILEEMSGEINALITKNSPHFEAAQDLVLDEIIGVTGSVGKDIIFVREFYIPDVPVSNEVKKSSEEEYVVFTSDVHVGSKMFFRDNFLKFIDWLNGKYGSGEQRKISKKVKYLFIVGDLVEGVGIYPGQENDLDVMDIYDQYEDFTKLIDKIRKDIQIIIIGGNHDALRLSEPQPVIDHEIAKSLYQLENVIFLTNPGVVQIGAKENFPGFSILLYHGFSFPYYAEEVESIRKAGRLDRCDLIMKFLLQRRHLAPSHQSTLYIPDPDIDSLIIDKVPDFFISGHIHKLAVSNYRGVTMINSGCWIDQTDYQEKQGMVPDPNKVPIVNLKTREVKILNFED